MTTFNTMNPVPSADARDRFDNSQVFDEYVTGTDLQTPDRMGVMRKTLTGLEQDFNTFLINSGFEPNHLTYVDSSPIQVDRPTQLIDRAGSVYRVKMPASFPVMLTGTWAADQLLLVDVGDQSLRQDLADTSGAGMVGYGLETVESALDSQSSATIIAKLSIGLSDYSAELNAFGALVTGGKTGKIPAGTYPCNSKITFPKHAKIDASGVTFDFSAAAVIGNFPGSVCVEFGGGALVELDPLSVAPTVGSYSITFAASQGLVQDDVIFIWEPAASSWSGFRTEYRAGEAVVVRNASGGTVNISSPLISSYGTTVRVFKLDHTKPSCKGLTVKCPTAISVTGVYVTLSRWAEFHNVWCTNTSVAGLTIDRSIGFAVSGGGSSSDRDVLTGDNYGLSISNSQWGLVMGGQYSARRHAVTMGGTSLDASIPTRFVKVKGADMSSWTIQCADMHGNVEYSSYENCTMHNGVTISGNNNSVRGCNIIAPANVDTGNGVAVSINEAKGVSFELTNLTIQANGDPSSTNRGVIDFGGNSSAMNANTVLAGTLLLSDIRLSAPNALIPWKIANNGSASGDKQLVVKDVHWNNPPAGRLSNGILQNVSGSQFTRADVSTKYKNAGAPAGYILDATKVSGLSESGSQALTTTATATQDVVVTFNNRFPKAPVVTVTPNVHIAGVIVTACCTTKGVSTATLRLYSTGGTAMTAGIAMALDWTAKLDE